MLLKIILKVFLLKIFKVRKKIFGEILMIMVGTHGQTLGTKVIIRVEDMMIPCQIWHVIIGSLNHWMM